ncbi:shikimate dehydrogenase [Paroceanicella profunda]|uniref:Shikimate dehydrogenase n=1 Tax=Paroceanicella profunda TaxID=2579971 RepID=A0A5B8FVG1_9RHOB|nr:shikimate dehydrogenase [Paroceanicella profunda]QDL92425.1 shikimate dehydrogenase [Paroceanicella profunda]
MSDTLKLGLIGDNIAASSAPRLHELAGRIMGRETRYLRLVPREMALSMPEIVAQVRAEGYGGLNITYPYKEKVLELLDVPDPRVARIGAVNTVSFTPEGPKGYNTDFTGFIAGFRAALGARAPGPVCMIGAGGVGKAVAFGLIELGLTRLCIVERDLPKAEALAGALRAAAPGLEVVVTGNAAEGSAGAAGLVNCTPVGMVGYGGTPLERPLMKGAEWVFDAVYTPLVTPFLADAEAEGLAIMSGYELFFYQGLHAVEIFHGRPVDEAALRAALKEG